MRNSEYEKVTIGSLVRIDKKQSYNYGRIGRVVYKRGTYVCIEPVEGEKDYKTNQYDHEGNGALLACHYAYLRTVE